MTDTLLVAASHPDTLASGRPIAPGDTIPRDALDENDRHDAQLIADGTFVDLTDVDREPERDDLATFVASSTIEQIEDRVGTDPDLAALVLAIEQERGSQARSTLIDKLRTLSDTSPRSGDAPTARDEPQTPPADPAPDHDHDPEA